MRTTKPPRRTPTWRSSRLRRPERRWPLLARSRRHRSRDWRAARHPVAAPQRRERADRRTGQLSGGAGSASVPEVGAAGTGPRDENRCRRAADQPAGSGRHARGAGRPFCRHSGRTAAATDLRDAQAWRDRPRQGLVHPAAHRRRRPAPRHHRTGTLRLPQTRRSDDPAGTCRFPTCSVPAERCDLDHHDPWPEGSTSSANLIPSAEDITGPRPRLAREHGTVMASTGPCPMPNSIGVWMSRCRMALIPDGEVVTQWQITPNCLDSTSSSEGRLLGFGPLSDALPTEALSG